MTEKHEKHEKMGRIMNTDDARFETLRATVKKHLKDVSCKGDFTISYNVLRNRFPDVNREKQMNFWRDDMKVFCDCDLVEKKS